MVGIDKTKQGIEAMAHLVVSLVSLTKNGLTISSTRKLIPVIFEIRALAKALAPITEELKDLDSDESKELVTFSFQLVQKIIAEIAE